MVLIVVRRGVTCRTPYIPQGPASNDVFLIHLLREGRHVGHKVRCSKAFDTEERSH